MFIEAKHKAIIPAVKPIMDALIGKAGFRVSQKLYQQVLQTANESCH